MLDTETCTSSTQLAIALLVGTSRLAWIREMAPIIVHVQLDKMIKFMESDTHYRNQSQPQAWDTVRTTQPVALARSLVPVVLHRGVRFYRRRSRNNRDDPQARDQGLEGVVAWYQSQVGFGMIWRTAAQNLRVDQNHDCTYVKPTKLQCG